MISPDISNQIISFYRGWYDWAEQTQGNEAAKFVLIDDLAPPAPRSCYGSLDEVRSALEQLLRATDDWNSSENILRRYSYSKLRQSMQYLSQSDSDSTTRESVERRGTKWLEVSVGRLQDLAEEIGRYRLRLLESGRSEAELRDYHDVRLDNEQVPALIKRFAELWLSRLYSKKTMLRPFSFKVEAVSSPRTWRNLVLHDGHGFVLRVNVAPQVYYTKGVAESMALHEVCGHMVHLQQLANNRRILETAPELLCLTIHGQDSHFAEGVAQFIPLYITEHLFNTPDPIRAELRNFELNFAVKHCNVTALIEGRATIDTAVAIHRKYLPWDEGAQQFYARIMKDSFFACMTLNYTASLDDFKPALRSDTDIPDRAFDRIMEGFYSPVDIPLMIAELRRLSR